ncbi:MAG: NADH-quinone oxidoreductase subunit NuoF [Bacteroidetes bacterium]|nr:NADH-quinone oxidoreductase subunit NuoF [Bacteroidota bacterium]
MISLAGYEKVILPDIPNLNQIAVYEKHGGYEGLKKAVSLSQDDVINEVKKSGLRGRGGAGFPTGLKWSFMPKGDKVRYLACNGDEGEPGTFKDRQIFEFNPHLFIEGTLIACYAMGIKTAYVYIRGEYVKWINILQASLDEAYAKGYVGQNILGKGFNTDIVIHRGAGAYICGEESSLMNSLEGKRPYPRIKPPFPAQVGLWGQPTTINNIETLANAAVILRKGADWYSKIGAEKHPGPVLYGISGHVNKPGVYEGPTGMSLKELIYDVAGGIKNGKKLKAVIPGGSSTPILTPESVEKATMDADGLRAVGTSMGTAGIIVMDEDTDLVEALHILSKFYHHESCGQCTPCREGTGWLEKIVGKFAAGTATQQDYDLLLKICANMEGRTVCALADAAAWPVRNTITRFKEEFEARMIENKNKAGWDYSMKAVSGV